MKKLLLMLLFFPLTIIPQTNIGPVNTPQINSTLYVGSLNGSQFYSTIQSAVTAACATGSNRVVDIPPAYTGADPISGVVGGCTTTTIKDEHNGLPNVCYTWQTSIYSSSGVQCNSVGSGGVTSLNSLTGGLSLTSTDSSVAITPSGSTINLQTISGTNVVQYNPSTTAYVVAGSSIYGDDSHVTSSAVPVTSWSCNGTTCTVVTTSAHNLVAGNWVQVSTITGWFANPTGIVGSYDTGYGVFQVLSVGLTSTQFEFNYSLNTGSGTGGNVYDADYYGAYELAKEPFFNGHGSVYFRQDTCANDVTYFTTKFGSITGSPKYLIVAGCQDDIYNNSSAASIESSLQSLWALAHTNGWIVIQTSQLSTNYGLGPCSSGNNCSLITMELNGWLPKQSKTFFNTSSNQYWNSYVDTAAYQYDWADNGPILGNTVAGGKMFAQRMNDAMSTQDSSVTGPVPYFHWDGGTGVNFGATNGIYSPGLQFLSGTQQYAQFQSVYEYFNLTTPGNLGSNGGVPALNLTDGSSGDIAQMFGGSANPAVVIGENLTAGNNSGYLGFNYTSSGSTSNYMNLGICTAVSTGYGPSGEQCSGRTDGIRIYPSGGVVLPSITTIPSTSPVCPNGTGGSLTTTGCSVGSGIAYLPNAQTFTNTNTFQTPSSTGTTQVVQGSYSYPSTSIVQYLVSSNSSSAAFASNVTAGNQIWAFCQSFNAGVTVTDAQSDSFTLYTQGGSNLNTSVSRAVSVVGGATTITANHSCSGALTIVETSGMGGVLDGTPIWTAFTGFPVTSSGITTTQQDVIVTALSINSGTSYTPTDSFSVSGYTQNPNNSNSNATPFAFDSLPAGTYIPKWTTITSGTWNGFEMVMAIKQTSNGGQTGNLVDYESASGSILSTINSDGSYSGPSFEQITANSTGGTCVMSSSTSCTLTIGYTYTTPVCLVTQQSATLTGGAAGCTVSGTTVTVTAAVANSETWGILVFGNPK